MEGKALIFKYLGNVDAIPLCIKTDDLKDIVSFCKWISPSVGGINIEDVESPKCFYLLDILREELSVPVFHDDQQGTATIVLAALTNALRLVNKKLSQVKIAMIGFGAANTANLRLLIAAGAKPENVIACDVKGTLYKDRASEFDVKDPRRKLSLITNPKNVKGGTRDALKNADVCIAFSGGHGGVIKPEWVQAMNKNSIVFTCANPIPEIWPWEAKEAGARIVATGRGDFPNQTNNSLVFPAIFRGALEVGAAKITDEMCIAAADAIADFAYRRGINEDYIVPKMDEEDVYIEEALAVSKMAIKQNLAKNPLPEKELKNRITQQIKLGKKIEKSLVDSGSIKT